jgi:hypothetical protein
MTNYFLLVPAFWWADYMKTALARQGENCQLEKIVNRNLATRDYPVSAIKHAQAAVKDTLMLNNRIPFRAQGAFYFFFSLSI